MNALRILIVDDDTETADLRRLVLSAAGHSVEILASSTEAMDRLERDRPDLLIVDIMMPELDGLEIALKGGQMGKADYFGAARGDR